MGSFFFYNPSRIWGEKKEVNMQLDSPSRKQEFSLALNIFGQALVTHACNLSHSGDRDQEDHGSKPASDK
jgi:hypothetical protein